MEYVYAALLLHKLGKPVDEHGMKKVLEAAGSNADEAKIKTLIASLNGVDLDKAMSEAAAMPAASSAGSAPAEKEEKKEEKAEESAEGLSALFG
jgi:large subunit ribosomal protein L12